MLARSSCHLPKKWVAWSQDTPQRCWLEMIWTNRWCRFGQHFPHHLLPHGQTANAGHIWLGNWRDQSLWWSELSKSVDPHFGNWLRDHVGTPGRCSQHEHGIVKDNQFTEAYKLQLSKEVQDIPCELQVGFTESDHWRTPLHRMARTLPHLRTQRGQARCLLQKSHWWRVACDLIGKRFPIVTVMIGVLEIGNDNLN